MSWGVQVMQLCFNAMGCTSHASLRLSTSLVTCCTSHVAIVTVKICHNGVYHNPNTHSLVCADADRGSEELEVGGHGLQPRRAQCLSYGGGPHAQAQAQVRACMYVCVTEVNASSMPSS